MIEKYSKSKHGNKKLSANFCVKEFACKDGSDYILIDTELVSLLQKIRNHFNKPVIINSAYRNPTYNKKVGGVSNSQHTKGTAADIVINGISPKTVAQYAEYLMPNNGGIGLYNSFTHVDTRANRSRWENFGKEKTVKGFYGYTENKSTTKYHVIGTTHIVEVEPKNIWAVETQKPTNQSPYNNFVNSIFFMAQANGLMYPQGIMVNGGKVLCNNPTHGKPVSTIIVHGENDVEFKKVADITKENNVWFAVSGYGIYPYITAVQEGFTGQFADVTRTTNRPIIGYRKSDNKIVIAVRANSNAQRAQETAKNLHLDFAISLDGGGSTTLKVNGTYKFKGDGRKLFGGLTWC
uniref:Peptidase n=1 Tax=Siphoviridae sp. ctsxw88 TaxID=2825701 RepID=A0A8S5PI31_9CAUD|nr:MAG TPA: peptidase [Siphoviridae sp. ctsxw88]